MDFFTFVSSLVSSLAWPTVVGFLIYQGREHIPSMLSRLEELTLPGGTTAKFTRELIEIKTQAEKLTVQAPPLAIDQTPDEEKAYLDLAASFPGAAVMEAYRVVEDALNTYKDKYPNSKRHSPEDMVETLASSQFADPEILPLFMRIRRMRNEAVHVRSFSISPAEALEYRRVCEFVAGVLVSAIELLQEKTNIAKYGYDGDRITTAQY